MTGNAAARVSRNAGVLVLGHVLRMMLNFVLVIYAARVLGVAGFGQYALGLLLFELFLTLSATGLCILVTREIAAARERTNTYLTAALTIVTPLTILAAAILIGTGRLIGYDAPVQAAIALSAIALLPAALALVLEAVFVAHERAEFVTLGTVLESAIGVGLAVFLLRSGYGIRSLFVVLIVSRSAMLLLYLTLQQCCLVPFRWVYDPACARGLIHDGKVLTGEIWVSTLNVNFAVMALSIFHGEAAVGLWVAAQKLLRPGALVAQSYVTAVFPHMTRLCHESRERFRCLGKDALRLMVLLVLPITITATLTADRVLALIYSDEYSGAAAILQVSIWTLLFLFFNPFLSRLLVAQGQPERPFWIATLKLCFLATVPLWLIYRFDGVGAAWAVLLADVFAFVLYFALTLGVVESRLAMVNYLRIAAPASALALFMWFLRNTEQLWLFALGVPLYVALLLVCGAFSWNDLKPFFAPQLEQK